MPFLTPSLLYEIKEIIRARHTAFVVNVFGHDSVPHDVLEWLQKKGLVDPKAHSIDDAYLYGQLYSLLEDPKVSSWTSKDVKDYVHKHPIPLTQAEEAAANTAQLTAAAYCVGLGNTVDKESGQMLIDFDQNLRTKLQTDIKEQTTKNIVARETVKQLKSDLGYATADWTRNLDRIAITEKHNAMQQGVADGFKKHFGNPRVALIPMPDACPDCKRLHLGPDGAPRIFKLSQLAPVGANVGKPKAAWVPCVGALHPHCQCSLVRVPDGWGFDEDGDLAPGGEYGVAYDEDAKKSFARLLEEESAHWDILEKAHRLAGRMDFDGLLIAIEQERGDVREWKDRNGESGLTMFHVPYGFIEGTKGADGEGIDVYVGPNPNAANVYVVKQRKKLPAGGFGGYDEDKCMLGFSSVAEAKRAYLDHYTDPGFMGAVLTIPFKDFRERVLQNEPKQVILKSARRPPHVSFVLKSETGGTFVSPAQGTSQAVEGGGAFLQAGAPMKPVHLNLAQAAGLQFVLNDPGNMRSDVVIKRDPHVYEYEPFQTRRFYVTEPGNLQADTYAEADNEAADRKAEMVRIAHQVMDVPRNYADPTWMPLGPAQRSWASMFPEAEGQDEDVRKALVEADAAWLVMHCAMRGVSLALHKSDHEQFALKVPKARGLSALVELKGTHDFQAPVIEGGGWYLLPVHRSELSEG